MPKVTILKGFPASGKSTFAKKQVQNGKGRVKRINKDDLRAMLDNSVYSWDAEKFVLKLRDQIILHALFGGYDVIVDDTNLHPKHEHHIRSLVGSSVVVEVIFFDVDIEECIKRDAQRSGTAHVGEKVIRKMAKDWERWKDIDCSVAEPDQDGVVRYVANNELPRAIIVDIDGTLAKNNGHRGFFEWDKVGDDDIIESVAELVRHYYYDLGYSVLLFSGRDSVCRQDTIAWLEMHNVPFDKLCMRAQGDGRGDDIVKSEMFDEYAADHYNVRFVVDDRFSVHKMWVSRGIHVFNVNQHLEYF